MFEPKWDGYRAICFLHGGRVKFISRNNRDLTQRFPELQGIGKSIKSDAAIIDGEIVALDENGMPAFNDLRKTTRKSIVAYFAFDLLFENGEDLRNHELIQRKAALKKILPRTGRIRYTDHVLTDGLDLFPAVKAQRMEGMLAKKIDSIYMAGRSNSWLKIKTESDVKNNSDGRRRATIASDNEKASLANHSKSRRTVLLIK